MTIGRPLVGALALAFSFGGTATAKQPWYGTYAHAYRASYINCRTHSQASLAREYHLRNDGAVLVALHWAQHAWRGQWQQPAFGGCLDGFMHTRPKVPHVQPWRA